MASECGCGHGLHVRGRVPMRARVRKAGACSGAIFTDLRAQPRKSRYIWLMDTGARRSTVCSEGWGWHATGGTGQYWPVPTGTVLHKACSGVRIVGRKTKGTGRYWLVLIGSAFQKTCSGGTGSWRQATDGTGRYWSILAGTAPLNACSGGVDCGAGNQRYQSVPFSTGRYRPSKDV
jgi:hypothetical protein